MASRVSRCQKGKHFGPGDQLESRQPSKAPRRLRHRSPSQPPSRSLSRGERTAPFTPQEMMLLFEERGRPARPGTGNRALGYCVHPDSPGQILLAPPDPGALRRGGVYWPSVGGTRQSSQTPYSSWGGDE